MGPSTLLCRMLALQGKEVALLCPLLCVPAPGQRNMSDIGPAELFVDEGVEVHQRIMAVNYMGVLHTVKAVLPDMLARNTGHILFMGSLMSMYGGSSSDLAVKPAWLDSLLVALLLAGLCICTLPFSDRDHRSGSNQVVLLPSPTWTCLLHVERE